MGCGAMEVGMDVDRAATAGEVGQLKEGKIDPLREARVALEALSYLQHAFHGIDIDAQGRASVFVDAGVVRFLREHRYIAPVETISGDSVACYDLTPLGRAALREFGR